MKSVERCVVFHVSELIKLFLLEKHADFRCLGWLLLGEHLVDIAQVEVALDGGDKWRGHLPSIQTLPVYPVEEDVTLNVVDTFRAEPLSWL